MTLGAWLSAAAWAGGLQDCPVAPFGDVSAAQYAVSLSGDCQGENSRLKLETPRAKPADAGPSLVKADFSSLSSLSFASVMGSLRFDWAGMRGGEAQRGGLRSERAAVSFGGLMRLHETLALQTSLGLERTGVQRNRATVSGVWQPSKLGVLFAEWAGSEAGTEAQRVGCRWWLVPRRLAIDLGARQTPDTTGWVDQRLGLSLDLPL